MFIQMNKLNNYIFSTCDTCNVRILCGDQVTIEQLRNVGVIALEPGCTIKSEKLTIYTHKIFTSEMKTGPEIDAPEISPINKIIKLSVPVTIDFEKDTDDFEANITNLGEKIKNIRTQDVIADNITFHDIHHYVVIYILMGMASLATMYLVCRRLRQRRNMPIEPAISLCNIASERRPAGAVPVVAAPRALRTAASTEPASSPAVLATSNTQDQATSPILRILKLQRDQI